MRATLAKGGEKIRVLVSGACGRMGGEVVRMVTAQDDMDLVAAADPVGAGKDAGEVALGKRMGVLIQPDVSSAINSSNPQVMVDFTTPKSVYANAIAAIELGVHPVVGTTGMSESQLDELRSRCERKNFGAVVAPNFAIGAVLMMQFARLAARYLPQAEIIELHHDKKLDSPSGTALKTAQAIAEGRKENVVSPGEGEPARGFFASNVPIHSVRLSGLVAHQEVIFGGLAQALSIRHDSFGRESFMPGVAMAIRKVQKLNGLVYGLEKLLEL